MPCTRTGIPLRSIPAGDGHVMRKICERTYIMKAVSASIVILAAAVLIAIGSHIAHHDTKVFVQLVGCGLGLAGLGVWYISLKEK